MWYFYGIALLAGIANAIEPGQNATLAKATGQPMLAGIVCFVIGIVNLFAIMLATRRLGLPGRHDVAQVPWWAWPGGILGAGIVLAQLYMSESMGAAPFLGLVVTGGVIASILLDHYGLVGFARRRASTWRIVGGGLMIAGVTLIAVY